MTNRLKMIDFAGLFDALLMDVLQTYPQDQLWLERDSKRIHLALRYRGSQFYTGVLPDLGALLFESLDQGRLVDTTGVAFGRHRSRRIHVPRIFSSLWLRIFNVDGLLLEDADPTAIFFLSSLLLVGKKVELGCTHHNLKEAYNEYISIDGRLPPEPRVWGDPLIVRDRDTYGDLTDYHGAGRHGENPLLPFGVRGVGPSLLTVCQKVADRLAGSLGSFDPWELVGRHGPGAVADLPFRGEKFSFPQWPERLEASFPFDWHGLLNQSLIDRDAHLSQQSALINSGEPVAVLLDVPKTRATPRLIAKEPTCNQWCQQATAEELRQRVKASLLGKSIDFFSQIPSQDAALEASKDGLNATIDLSSASDRLSCALIQRIFRANYTLMDLLIATRTRYVRFSDNAPFQKLMKLRKFASMGSALTFPVQSVVFAILAIGVGKYRHPKSSIASLARQVRVFGDDIIVPKTWVEDLNSLFSELGLSVNMSKSFWSGYFRESCGMFAYAGHDVTPFRLKHDRVADPVSTWSMVSVANTAFEKGLWHTSIWIERQLLSGLVIPAVDRRHHRLGLISSSKGLDPNRRRRWNPNLQREEVLSTLAFERAPSTKDPVGLLSYSYLIGVKPAISWKSYLYGPSGASRPLVYSEDQVQKPAVFRKHWVDAALLS